MGTRPVSDVPAKRVIPSPLNRVDTGRVVTFGVWGSAFQVTPQGVYGQRDPPAEFGGWGDGGVRLVECAE